MVLFFAWRYLRASKSTQTIHVIAYISVAAIAVGGAALIVILSVFNGLSQLVTDLYADFYPDIKILPASGQVIHLTQAQLEKIKHVNHVQQYALSVQTKAVLANAELQNMVYLTGVDSNFTRVVPISKHKVEGRYNLGDKETPHLYIGGVLQQSLAVEIQEPTPLLTLYTPNRLASTLTLDEALHSYRATATGSFAMQQVFDSKYVFTNIHFLKYMLGYDANEYSSVEIKVEPNSNTEAVRGAIQQLLGNQYVCKTRLEQNASLYAVINTEKLAIYAVLTLILIVAAFNMVGAIAMLVIEKKTDIFLLKSMGATNATIQSIFFTAGILLGSIGGLIGFCIAIVFCWMQQYFHFIKISSDTFIIDYYPVLIKWTDMVLVAFTILCIASIAAWFSSRSITSKNGTYSS